MKKRNIFYSGFQIFLLTGLLWLNACSVSRQASNTMADEAAVLINDPAIKNGHLGICIYEPELNKFWDNYNADKYFIPASNTKLFTLYAGMKFIGDSLTAAFYKEENGMVYLVGTGDPTFLHPDFPRQPLFDFLMKNKGKKITLFENLPINSSSVKFKALGRGWAWDDFNTNYMVERSFFPIYGNIATFNLQNDTVSVTPPYFKKKFVQSTNYLTSIGANRNRENNWFVIEQDGTGSTKAEIAFKTGFDANLELVEANLLSDTLHQKIGTGTITLHSRKGYTRIYSQPSDSLFKLMMHRSDNFFAEQTLLMASNEYLGYMSDADIIDTLLKTDLKDLPQKPKWVDGSGLSRYNLFTPQSFVYLLNKMKNEFGLKRVEDILATGGTGTLAAYYKTAAGFIYAKTGTLSNNCALSGFLITKKGKLLVFSVLANNYPGSAAPVRRAIEKYLLSIREKN